MTITKNDLLTIPRNRLRYILRRLHWLALMPDAGFPALTESEEELAEPLRQRMREAGVTPETFGMRNDPNGATWDLGIDDPLDMLFAQSFADEHAVTGRVSPADVFPVEHAPFPDAQWHLWGIARTRIVIHPQIQTSPIVCQALRDVGEPPLGKRNVRSGMIEFNRKDCEQIAAMSATRKAWPL